MTYRIFVILGIINLIWILRMDLKTMKIDQRHNSFMLGVATFMFILNYPGILIMIGLFVMVFVMGYMISRYAGMGDVQVATWAILGFGSLNIVWAFIYIVCFVCFRLLYVIPMRRAKVEKLPGTPIFMGAFIVTAAIALYMDYLIYGVIF